MATVLVPIADGTEELEAVTLIDLLRRAGLDVTVASVMPGLTVVASRGVKLVADCLIGDCSNQQWDLITLPGGMPGAENLSQNSSLVALLEKQLQAEKLVGAVCASPAVVLGRNQLIKGYSATCYPSFQQELSEHGAIVEAGDVVQCKNLITSCGPGTCAQLSLALIEFMLGADKRNEVASAALF